MALTFKFGYLVSRLNALVVDCARAESGSKTSATSAQSTARRTSDVELQLRARRSTPRESTSIAAPQKNSRSPRRLSMLPPNDPSAAVSTNSRLIQLLKPKFQINASTQMPVELLQPRTQCPQ